MINFHVYHYDQGMLCCIGLGDPINIVTIIESNIHRVKDYELKSEDLVESLYSDAGITKAVLLVWELLLE